MDLEIPSINLNDEEIEVKTKRKIIKAKQPQFSCKTKGLIAIVFVFIIGLSSCMTVLILKSNKELPVVENPSELGLKILTGNGFCDDATNTNAFNFDDGDCCLPNAKQGNCKLCTCHIDGKQITGEQTTIETKAKTTTKSVTTSTTVTITTSVTTTNGVMNTRGVTKMHKPKKPENETVMIKSGKPTCKQNDIHLRQKRSLQNL